MSRTPSDPQLQIQNEELENYFANTIIPQLFVDANMVLRKFTPPAMKQFSLSSSDLGRNIEEVKDHFRISTLVDNISEVIETQAVLEKEVQTLDKKWYQMNILPYRVRKENRTNGVIITFVEITQRIANLKELEKINSEYNTLIYAIAHDIRQPMSTIVLLAEALKLAFVNRDEEQFEKWISRLKFTSKEMENLVKGFSKRKREKMDLKKPLDRVNIQNIVEDVTLALKPDLVEASAVLSKNFETSEIYFPRTHLRSIVFNLMNNAIKYRQEDRPLELYIGMEKVEEMVVLTISDNGIGIAEEHHKKVFAKAGRVNYEVEGTGMGLYIVKCMLDNHGGYIELESTPGEGSTFKISFHGSYEKEE